jgi:NAD+ kinase
MQIALYGNSFDSIYNPAIFQLVSALENSGHELIVFRELADFMQAHIGYESKRKFVGHDDLGRPDVMISIGGDGTILNTLIHVRDSEIPVLGLNTGRLGFLSTVSTDQVEEIVSALNEKHYDLDARSVLSVKSSAGLFEPVNWALNEVAVHKNDRSSMITVSTFVDGVYIASYWADGLIVSTATGSTAYSMSCGGPIVAPGSSTFVITPIAPHNLNIRPLVVPDSSVIKLVVEGRESHHLVSLDSRSESLENSHTLEISKAPFKMHLLRLKGHHFIETIRTKLMWGMDKRN